MKHTCLILCLSVLAGCGPPPNDRKIPTYAPPIGESTALATIQGSDVPNKFPLLDSRTAWVIAVDGYRVAKAKLRGDGLPLPVDRGDWNSAVVIPPGNRKIYSGFQFGVGTYGSYSEAVIPFNAQPGHSYRVRVETRGGLSTCDFWIVDDRTNTVVSEIVHKKIHAGMVAPVITGAR